MANNLKREKQIAVLNGLVEGASVRSVERLTGVHRDTILRLMVRVGEGCHRLMDATLRNLDCEKVQIDEAWTFVAKKQRHVRDTDDPRQVGDFWAFVAVDPDSKLVPAHFVAKRTVANAVAFLQDLHSRLAGRIQLSSDAFLAYVEAVDHVFGSDVDYGQIVKFYEGEPIGPGRYSPPKVVSAERFVVWGTPDPAHICTSHIERLNLSLRTSLRRFTRLSLGFSRKPENLRAAVALFFGHYNFVRRHRSLRVTPAMEAGVTPNLWKMADLLDAALGSTA